MGGRGIEIGQGTKRVESNDAEEWTKGANRGWDRGVGRVCDIKDNSLDAHQRWCIDRVPDQDNIILSYGGIEDVYSLRISQFSQD